MSVPVLYQSTDASAPLWTGGSSSSLIPVLDACLVNGYGSKPAAGWTKEFSAAGKAIYRMGGPTGARMYFRIDEVTNTNTYLVRGAEGASGIDTLVDPFPTVAQMANGLALARGSVLAGGRYWYVIADANRFFLYTTSGVGAVSPVTTTVGTKTNYLSSSATLLFFGRFKSLQGADNYNVCIYGASNNPFNPLGGMSIVHNFTNDSANHYIARNYLGTNKSKAFGKVMTQFTDPANFQTGSYSLFPSEISGDFTILKNKWLMHELSQSSRRTIRGILPSLYLPFGNVTLNAADPKLFTPYDGYLNEVGKTVTLLPCESQMIAWTDGITWDD